MATNIEPEFMTGELSEDGSKRHSFIKKLAENVRQDDRDREVWKQKQIVASNQRLGVRRRTNSPYPGFEEVPIPTTDKVIKQKKAIFLSVATVPNKQVQVSVDESQETILQARESATKIERAINNLIRKKDFGWTKKVALFIDYFLENGHALFKVFEKFTSKISHITINLDDFEDSELAEIKKLKDDEIADIIANRYEMDLDDKDDEKSVKDAVKQFRKGNNVITMTRREFNSEPSIVPVKGIDIIVPASATDVHSLPRITHDMWVTYEFLKERGDRGVYNKDVVDQLSPDDGTTDDRLTNVNWALSEGITNVNAGGKNGLFNIRESQTFYKNEKSGKLEKWVFTWIEEHGNTDNGGQFNKDGKDLKILQESKLEYDHGFWTYVKHDHEYKNTRWLASRGVPEQIRGMHIITEKMFNSRVIRDEYNNAPMYRASKQLGWSGDEIRLRPGQIIEAEQGEFEQINKSITVDSSSAQIEAQAKAYIEEYQAIPDLGQSNANNREKTATEVGAITAALAQQANTETALFLESLSEVAQHMFWIIKQGVTKPKIVGGVLLTPEDFQWILHVSWTGSIEAANVNIRSAKLMEKLNLLMNVAVPMGLATKENVYNALRMIYEADPDIENPDLFLTKPQEMLVDQTEDQMNELVMMMNGFGPQVKPDDDHTTHIQVIEEWIQSPVGQQAMQNQQIATLVETHANLHMQMEKEQQGLPKGAAGGAELSAANRARQQ